MPFMAMGSKSQKHKTPQEENRILFEDEVKLKKHLLKQH
jgi:hypothetical protein